MSRGYERSLEDHRAQVRAAFEAHRAWAQAAYPQARRTADTCLDLLERRSPVARALAQETPTLCFCRSDPRFANVIVRPGGRLGLVDWEDSGLRDPARDLADIVLHPNQEDLLGEDEWRAFTCPYVAGHGADGPGIVRRAHLYGALFHLFFLAAIIRGGLRRAQTGQLAGWEVNGMEANERLRRYLARGLTWPESDFGEALEDLSEVAFFPGCESQRNRISSEKSDF
jgi:aminoglycoside phosphotransferase (APT) family kinase protein